MEFSDIFTIDDFTKRIPGLSAASIELDTLEPYWYQLQRFLKKVLPATHSFWEARSSELNADLADAFTDYVVYSIWAGFVRQGHVMNTETGQVMKERSGSMALDDTQQAELYREYADLAKAASNDLVKLAETPKPCATPVRTSQQYTVVTAKRRSKF